MKNNISPNGLATAENTSENDRLNTINRTVKEDLMPFFSVRKLRVVYNELQGQHDFAFLSFESFKQDVLASTAPQLELNRWESIASRR